MKLHALLPFLVVALPTAASAQTGAPLLLDPWLVYGTEREYEATVELSAGALYLDGADIDDTDDELDLGLFESQGRVKLSDEPGPGPSLGYEALHLDLNTGDPALPERLSDTSLATAFGWRLDDDWELGLVAGAGYAGTTPYRDSEAFYFLADVILAKQLDERSKLTLNLNFNGNRNVWPDIPLPAVSYARRSEIEGLTYIVGFPFTRITYRPDDRWTLSATYSVPYSIEARVGYRVDEPLELFAAYDSFTRGFWLEDAPGSDNRRIFFTQRRAEAGVVWNAHGQADLTLAGGYAFDQEFETGWDLRDTDNLRDVDPAPYIRAALNFAW